MKPRNDWRRWQLGIKRGPATEIARVPPSEHMIKTRHKIGVIEVAIVLAIVSIPIAVAISYWNNARFVKEDSRMARAASFMLLTYASGNNCMPPTRVRGAGGEVLSSWRFAAADSMIYEVEDEKKFGYPSVDKAWNAQGNAELRNSSGFPFYIDPTRPGTKQDSWQSPVQAQLLTRRLLAVFRVTKRT